MEKMGREEIVAMYKPDVERLLPYLSWLRDKSGADVTKSYEADDNKKTIAFPVYDGTLLAFLNELGSTVFMNQNSIIVRLVITVSTDVASTLNYQYLFIFFFC